jgi:tRNA nucleotidyltransferase (CCA-adding enzyme)
MVGKGPESSLKSTPMPPESRKIEPETIPERLSALPGLDRVREAAAEIPAYLVGGAVRDLLLGRERTDVDIVVEGNAEELGRRLGGEIQTHERFATATVHAEGLEVDLARARSESYPEPGALPEVRPATLTEDLARRDFTVNAMALPLAGAAELIDPHGGRADLEGGVLRVLHDRSFVDDPTRALRAARYVARYGFALEPQTGRLLRDSDLETVSADRVAAELRKLAREEEARRGFELLDEWGLVPLAEGAPELIDAVAALTAKEPWSRVADRGDAVLAAATTGGSSAARELAGADVAGPSEGVERARGHDGVTLALARALGAEWLDRYVEEWRDVRLDIDGEDLIEAGIPEGPAIGRGLAAALRAKLDSEVSGRDEELRVALDAARSQ